jgi:protein phosphatase PTC7
MNRSTFRRKVALLHPPCRFFQNTSRCHPELTFSTSGTAHSPVPQKSLSPFKFETGLALFAKRAPRPFPPPFLSPPSGSFSDPLSTHHRSRDRRSFVNGELIRGYTNGDDAVYASDHFIGANDGVGAWSTRAGGHAGSVYVIVVLAQY